MIFNFGLTCNGIPYPSPYTINSYFGTSTTSNECREIATPKVPVEQYIIYYWYYEIHKQLHVAMPVQLNSLPNQLSN